MAITIRDIAEQAKVARSTVSRALNNKGRMSSATRDKIRQLARELGYHPNMNAKIIVGMEEAIEKQGYHLIFSTTDGGPSVPRCVEERRVDGVILMGCDICKDLILSLNGTPLVLVDNHLEGVDSIAIDNGGGAYKAVEYLIKLGYRKIGFIAERLTDLSFKERFKGYKLALKEHGLEYNADLVAEGLTPPDHGYVAMKKLLKRGTPPAIFAANDSTAAGREKMASIAAKRLMELIENSEQPPVQLKLPTELVIRESCASR
jgi:LacI family transcriptional regulator